MLVGLRAVLRRLAQGDSFPSIVHLRDQFWAITASPFHGVWFGSSSTSGRSLGRSEILGLRVGREELKLRLDSKEGRHDLAFPGIWSTLTFF